MRPSLAVDEDSTLRVDLSEDDHFPSGNPLSYALAIGPNGLAVDTDGILTWRPIEAQGPSTNVVEVAVSDGTTGTSERFSIVVREVNVLPNLAGATNTTMNELVSYTQDLAPQDSDIPEQPPAVTLLSGPTGLVVTNGVLAWTPTEAQGPSTNEVVVTVSDGVGSLTNSFSVVVREVNSLPALPV